jgi:thiol-disulfide isomerase/thioredoxin
LKPFASDAWPPRHQGHAGTSPARGATPGDTGTGRRALLVAGTALIGAAGLLRARDATAASPRLQAFGRDSWTRLSGSLPRPAMVVFSATWCVNCPAVIEDLSAITRARPGGARLVVVVMDGADDPTVAREPHYRLADRLMVFQGDDAALRFSVNPAWRGITPYVALLGADGAAPVFVSGRPSDAQISAWARARKA